MNSFVGNSDTSHFEFDIDVIFYVTSAQDYSSNIFEIQRAFWKSSFVSIIGVNLTLAVILVPGTTVLVHGDAGVDATLQVTSLAQVLLDPICRTAKG